MTDSLVELVCPRCKHEWCHRRHTRQQILANAQEMRELDVLAAGHFDIPAWLRARVQSEIARREADADRPCGHDGAPLGYDSSWDEVRWEAD